MHTLIKVISLYIILLVFTACSSTSVVTSWNDKNTEPKKYSRIGVVVITPNSNSRVTVEDAIANELRAKGTNAHPTFNTFPFAGKIGEIGLDSATIEQKIKQKVADSKFDAIITVALLDKRKEERYVEGSSISLAAPIYSNTYYGYYSYAYTTVYSSGYYTTSTTYFLETNLYDVGTEKLLYTAQTKTIDPSSIDKESENFARMIVADMINKKVIAN